MSANFGFDCRSSRVSPCTREAPSSMSRSGLTYTWNCRSVTARLRISTQPISMMRSPSLGLSPVVSVSRTICRKRYPFICELVRSFVFRVSGVALHPAPFYVVFGRELIQLAPQILVFHFLLVRRAPALLFPRVDPLGDPLL